MPTSGSQWLKRELIQLEEKLKNEKDPVEIAKIKAAIDKVKSGLEEEKSNRDN